MEGIADDTGAYIGAGFGSGREPNGAEGLEGTRSPPSFIVFSDLALLRDLRISRLGDIGDSRNPDGTMTMPSLRRSRPTFVESGGSEVNSTVAFSPFSLTSKADVDAKVILNLPRKSVFQCFLILSRVASDAVLDVPF